MFASLKLQLLNFLLPAIIAPLTFLVTQQLKRVSLWVDSLGDWQKRGAVFVIATGLTALGTLLGVNFKCDPSTAVNCLASLDSDTVTTALQAGAATLIALLLHAGKDSTAK